MPLTKYETVESASGETPVILARGTYPQLAEEIVRRNTADGADISATPGIVPPAPTDQEAIAQVKSLAGAGVSIHDKLPEYTCDMKIAESYSSGAIVVIEIKRRFLNKGSTSESGWVCRPEAPLVKAGWYAFTKKTEGKVNLMNSKGRPIRAD